MELCVHPHGGMAAWDIMRRHLSESQEARQQETHPTGPCSATSAFQTVKINVCCLSHTACGVLLQQLLHEQTTILIKIGK